MNIVAADLRRSIPNERMMNKPAIPGPEDGMTRRYAMLIFAISLLSFAAFTMGRQFHGLETRFVFFVQEMQRTGFTWYPHTNFGPYPDYPGTFTWLIYALTHAGGELTPTLAILPSAVASAATLALVWLIGCRHSKAWGALGVLTLASTIEFQMHARAVSPDPLVMFLASCNFYLALKALLNDRAPFNTAMLLVVFLAVSVRGPIGGVVCTGVVCAVFLVSRQWKRFLLFGTSALIVIVGAYLVWLYLAYLEGGRAFVERVLDWQVLGRLGHTEKDSALGTYVLGAMGNYAIAYPLAVVAAISAWRHRDRLSARERTMLLCVGAWILVILIGMSLPYTKKTRYLLPAAPGLALAAGALFLEKPGICSDVCLKVTRFLLAVFPAALLLVMIVLRVWPDMDIVAQLHLRPNLTVSIALVSIPAALSIWAITGSSPKYRSWTVLVCCMISIFAVKVSLLEPGQDRKWPSAAFVSSVELSRQAAPVASPLVFVGLGPDNQDLNYLVAAKSAERPEYLLRPRDVNAIAMPATVIIRQKAFDEFTSVCNRNWKEIARGKLGHTEVVAFQLSDSGG